MRPSLIVFIDCFPQLSLPPDFLSGLPGRAGIRPGFGYSVNILAELFAGKTPDDVGFFNIFGYNPASEWLAPWVPALRLLAPAKKVYFADRVAHRLLTRAVGYTGNIPFEHIGCFEPSGVYPFSPDFPHTTIFSDPRFVGTRVLHSELRGVRPPDRDRVLVRRALEAVRPGESIFLSLSDLDAQAHAHGVGTPEFLERIEEYQLWLGDLIDRFLGANPGGYVAVLSDHGAANTHATHDLRVEQSLGRARPDRYMYFLDATLARFWTPDPSMEAAVAEFLAADGRGQLVTEEERSRYGLTSRAFGDFIWVVDEGYGISPSFLGRGLSRSLHGYHPELDSQRAIFLSSDPLPEHRYSAVGAYQALLDGTRLRAPAAPAGREHV